MELLTQTKPKPHKEANMKLKKTILTTLISVTGFTFGNALDQDQAAPFKPKSFGSAPKVEQGSFYQKFSMLFTSPSYGLGYRERSGNFGYDVSMNISPLYVTNAVAARAALLTFLGNSNAKNVPYLGLGIGGLGTYNTKSKLKNLPNAGTYGRQEETLVARGTANAILGFQEENGFWEIDLGVTPKFATTEKDIKATKANLDGKIAGFSVTVSKGWNF